MPLMLHEHRILPPCATIGIMGGGQLGRMMAMAAASLGYHVHIFTPEEDCPAAEVARYVTVAPYEDLAAVEAFAHSVDVMTLEFENIPYKAAQAAQAVKPFYPSPDIVACAQHRGREKQCATDAGVETPNYQIADSYEGLLRAVEHVGTPCIIKTTTMGYDGKGQYRVQDASQCTDAWRALGMREVIIEAFVPFVAEASVMVARGQDGTMHTFPVTRNEHEGGILRTSYVPSGLSATTQTALEHAACAMAQRAELVGLLAFEFFILADGSICFNEMAPRPHNSTHWTMDACNISQFEQLMRICAGLPLKKPTLRATCRMVNLIGDDMNELAKWHHDPHAHVHVYGKAECREGRKMGHVNIVGDAL
ncbi:MAG: 5-(carboxyamino)imidazole ribonucleotide synthase [Alphaproteobacteria bacterium]|nr:MAG: 5-(carboxyamino)imidazole ribonucleotide synthase [Alphaproteobacteria bacterium]